MNNKQFLFAVVLGAIVGCAGNQLAQVATVEAQVEPGQFRECVSYSMDYDRDHEDLGANAKSIVGWTPVGGAGISNGTFVVLCR